MIRFGFPSRCKLKKTDEFSSVFNFRKRVSGFYLIVHYMPTMRDYPRLGLIVGRKLARGAVQRNYMKRVVREWFRQHRGLEGMDLLVRPLRAFGCNEHAQVRAEFSRLLEVLQARNPRTFMP